MRGGPPAAVVDRGEILESPRDQESEMEEEEEMDNAGEGGGQPKYNIRHPSPFLFKSPYRTYKATKYAPNLTNSTSTVNRKRNYDNRSLIALWMCLLHFHSTCSTRRVHERPNKEVHSVVQCLAEVAASSQLLFTMRKVQWSDLNKKSSKLYA